MGAVSHFNLKGHLSLHRPNANSRDLRDTLGTDTAVSRYPRSVDKDKGSPSLLEGVNCLTLTSVKPISPEKDNQFVRATALISEKQISATNPCQKEHFSHSRSPSTLA
jgi:hypothetical protein